MLSDNRVVPNLEIWLNEDRYSCNESPFIAMCERNGTKDCSKLYALGSALLKRRNNTRQLSNITVILN